jgi:hypothetical protein
MDSSFSFPQHPDHHPFERPVLPQSIWEFPTSRRLLLYQVAFGRCLDTGLAKGGLTARSVRLPLVKLVQAGRLVEDNSATVPHDHAHIDRLWIGESRVHVLEVGPPIR